MSLFGRKPLPPARDLAAEIIALRDSRRVIVEAYEIERHRIERDLHDGAQQFLVAAGFKIGEAALLVSDRTPLDVAGTAMVKALLVEAQEAVDGALKALRRTVSGVHPQLLSDQGLVAAVRDLSESSPVPVQVIAPYPLPQLPPGVAATAYFAVSEALTNVAKYCPAPVSVTVLLTAGADLRVTVVDNGPGGAILKPGHGLAGLRERVAAFGGSFELSSPVGGPTSMAVSVPMLLAPVADSVHK